MTGDDAVRRQVVALLAGGQAHLTFDDAVAEFPMHDINHTIPNGTYSPWQLLEHLRLAQRDILLFMTDPQYQAPAWPDDYWPAHGATATPEQWQQTIDGFRADLKTLIQMAGDANLDLHQPLAWGDGQTPLREFLLVADHNAYHIGEFAILRQIMNTWPAGRE